MRLERAGRLDHACVEVLHEAQGTRAGQRLDTAHAGRHTAFGNDLEKADIAGARHVGAAAQLGGKIAHAEDAHLFAVLLAEQRHRAGLERGIMLHDARGHRVVGANLLVHQTFHGADLVVRHRLVVRKIKARLVGVDQGAFLLHVVAQHLAQGRVHQVRRRVVELRGGTRRHVDMGAEHVAYLQGAGGQLAVMAEHVGLDLLRIGHREGAVRRHQLADVAHLAAGFCIERCLVEHDNAGIAVLQNLHRRAILVEGNDAAAVDFKCLVAFELGLAAVIGNTCRHLELRRRTRLLALFIHRRLVAGNVDRLAALARHVGGEVDREAEGVVQREHGFAVKQVALARQRGVKDLHAVFQGLGKALFLGEQGFFHPLCVRREFRISAAHHQHQILDQFVEERLGLPELVSVAQGTADDPAQHIPAAVIGRNHAVDDQERAGADVVGNHLERWLRQVLDAALFSINFARRRLDQILEQVNLVIRMHMLQHCRNPLQAHAGIDTGLGQARHVAVGLTVELHEHQVPDLDVAVTVGIGRTGRAAGNVRAMVVEDFRARAAGAGIGHLPEIVGGVLGTLVVTDAHDALFGHADFVGPDVVGLVVIDVDRNPELVFGQTVNAGQQFPGVFDCVMLEIVTKREVAEHLEKRMVARRITDVFQVVVLAAGAHAALRRGGTRVAAMVFADEHVLELHHARVGEQQRRIIARHQRTRGHAGVALRFKIGQEFLADFGCVHGFFV